MEKEVSGSPSMSAGQTAPTASPGSHYVEGSVKDHHIEKIRDEYPHLKGEEVEQSTKLSFPIILLITINSIMGTGIYFLPAIGARESGLMSIISWFIMSVIALYISMCFSELASMFPFSGGVYEYCRQAFGPFASFLIGWGTLIAGNVTIAMLIVGAITYLNPELPSLIIIAICLFFILIFNYMAYKGVKTSSVMLVTFALITLGTMMSLVIPGLFKLNPGNFTPFVTHPWSTVFLTLFFIAETFFGWESATFLAEQTKDPKRTIPKALIIGTSLIAIISLGFVIAALGNIHWEIFGNSSAPLADLGTAIYGSSATQIFSILVYLSIVGAVACWIFASPQLVQALAKDKMFIVQMAKIHEKNKTPYRAIQFQAVITSFLVIMAAGSYETLLEMLLPLVLVLYCCVLYAVIHLRKKMPDHERPFKAPYGHIGPYFVIAIILSLLGLWISHVHDAVRIISILLSFFGIGVAIFLLLLVYYDPGWIVRLTNWFAYLNLLLEGLVLPKKLKKEIVELFEDDLPGANVLEYGSGVGTLTLALAKKVGPNGKIYATDLGALNIRILRKRLDKRGHNQVQPIHDIHHVNRIHPDVGSVDLAFSVGNLSYIQDVDKFLTQVSERMQEGGKLCFVEYVDYFWFVPNANWLSELDNVRKVFKEAGFAIRIRREKALFWNYMFIYGIKSSDEVPYI